MNAIVTGASKGIGFYTVLELFEKGVEQVIAISRSAEGLKKLSETCLERFGEVKLICLEYDIVDVLEANNLLGKIDLNKVDILINNAGMLINSPFAKFSVIDAKRLFDVNFHAPAQLSNMLLPLLEASKWAHVVNISSMGGYQGSSKFSGLSYYSASKAAIAALTECLAEEFKETTVRFNCLAFGAVQTEMLAKAFPDYKAPLTAMQMGAYVADFAINGHKYYNGQILPVCLSNP